MTKTKQIIFTILAIVLTVLYFWYLGYNVMIMDNPLFSELNFHQNNAVVEVTNWE